MGGMPDDMPPMNDTPQDLPDDMPDDMPEMPDDMNDAPKSDEDFDADFDPGVDADEDDDPKRYIQQLAGKLSQSLRKYNSEQPRPDADLCKYVVGMTAAQAVEGLSQDDVNEILDKITGENDDDKDSDRDDADKSPDDDMPDFGEDDEPSDEGAPEPEPSKGFDGKESVQPHRLNIKERTIDVARDKKSDFDAKPNKNKGYRNKPFKSPY